MLITPTEATEADLPLILNSYSASQSQHYRGPRQAIRLWLRQRLLDVLSEPNSYALVANSDGVALGCLVAVAEGGGRLVVAHLYTKAAFRRQGVATQMLSFACSGLGGSELAYSCRTFRAAERWAQRLGAVHVGDYGTHHERASGIHRQRGAGD